MIFRAVINFSDAGLAPFISPQGNSGSARTDGLGAVCRALGYRNGEGQRCNIDRVVRWLRPCLSENNRRQSSDRAVVGTSDRHSCDNRTYLLEQDKLPILGRKFKHGSEESRQSRAARIQQLGIKFIPLSACPYELLLELGAL